MKPNFLALFLLLSVPAWAQWEWQNPWPQGNYLNAVHATDAQHCWMAGDIGTILFTDGNTIVPQKSGTFHDLKDLFFFDNQEGWAGGENGTLLHYKDDVWTEVNAGLTSGINAFHFLSNELGWAACSDGKVLQLANGLWSLMPQQPSIGALQALWFDHPQEGWVGDDYGRIQHFNGTTWVTENVPPQIEEVIWIKRLENGTLWASCTVVIDPGDPGEPIYGRQMLRYENGMWVLVPDSHLASSVISFVNDSLFVYASSTWNTKYHARIAGGVLGVKDVAMIDANHAWAVGTKGGISFFDGNTWTDLSKGFYGGTLLDIEMFNQEGGVIVAPNSDFYYKLKDGIWGPDEMYNCFSFDLRSIDFFQPDYGWAVGEYGRIWTYEDDKIACSYQTVLPNDLINVQVINASSGWVVDDMGDLFKVQLPWGIENHSIDQNKSIKDFHFNSLDDGWAAGWDGDLHAGFVYHYQNGIWTKIKLIAGFEINALYLSAADDIWVAGRNNVEGNCMIGHFNGQTWSYWEDFEMGTFYDIHFTSPENAWAVGTNGKIFHFDGQNWNKKPQLTNAALRKIYFLDEQNGWIVGNEGTVLHITNGGSSTGTSEESITDAKGYSISPNPSTSFITINHAGAPETDLNLTLFDTFGRIVQQYQNIAPGTPLDVRQLISGIYYWTITKEGHKMDTGKLLILGGD